LYTDETDFPAIQHMKNCYALFLSYEGQLEIQLWRNVLLKMQIPLICKKREAFPGALFSHMVFSSSLTHQSITVRKVGWGCWGHHNKQVEKKHTNWYILPEEAEIRPRGCRDIQFREVSWVETFFLGRGLNTLGNNILEIWPDKGLALLFSPPFPLFRQQRGQKSKAGRPTGSPLSPVNKSENVRRKNKEWQLTASHIKPCKSPSPPSCRRC
jgi:hypothetical protein